MASANSVTDHNDYDSNDEHQSFAGDIKNESNNPDNLDALSHNEGEAGITELKNEKLVCPFEGCGKTFRGGWSLTRHVRRHNGFKPFRCPCCFKDFVEKCALKRHEQTHITDFPWVCKFPACGKRFKLKEYLDVHKRLHPDGLQYIEEIDELLLDSNCTAEQMRQRLLDLSTRHKDNRQEGKDRAQLYFDAFSTCFTLIENMFVDGSIAEKWEERVKNTIMQLSYIRAQNDLASSDLNSVKEFGEGNHSSDLVSGRGQISTSDKNSESTSGALEKKRKRGNTQLEDANKYSSSNFNFARMGTDSDIANFTTSSAIFRGLQHQISSQSSNGDLAYRFSNEGILSSFSGPLVNVSRNVKDVIEWYAERQKKY